jgi:hypothetical protein
MRSPMYYTQFLACVEGRHGQCQQRDQEGLVEWICQCECHPRDLNAPDNNYALFPPLSQGMQMILRYAGLQYSGVPKGLRRCVRCGDWRGLALLSQDPLEWHLGFIRHACRCDPD